jgi:hypothetical protein
MRVPAPLAGGAVAYSEVSAMKRDHRCHAARGPRSRERVDGQVRLALGFLSHIMVAKGVNGK